MSSMIRTTLSIAAALALFASTSTVAQESDTDTYNASSGGEAKASVASGTLQGTLSADSDALGVVSAATAAVPNDGAAAEPSTASGGAPASATYVGNESGASVK